MTEDLWVFKHAPKKLDEMIVTDEKKVMLQKIIDEIPNCIIAGKPGTGKGTFMEILLNQLPNTCLKINASMENSIDDIRTKVYKFATAFDPTNKKIVYLNECLEENEEIRTPGGNLKLKDMEFGRKYDVLSKNMSDGSVEFDKAEKLHEKIDDIYEIELENGYKIKCNLNHEFFIKDENNNKIRKKLKDLSEGDSILTE